VTTTGLSVEEIHELGFKRTARGWLPLDAIQDGLTKQQWKRWSYVSLKGTLAIPPGALRAFEVAVRLGKIMREDRTFDPIRNAGDVLCIEVRPVHRDKALELLQREPRTWERHVSAWCSARMAHRCPNKSRGVVVLFLRPEEVCPACGSNF